MRPSTNSSLKALLTRIGAMLPERTLYYLNGLVNYLEVGHWMRARGFDTRVRFDDKWKLFDFAAEKVADRDVLYLEFGVSRGDSFRYWSRALRSPNAKLHGFDSFAGLPTDWILGKPKGTFSTGGEPPQVDDPRARFFQGWFQDTLPTYSWPDHERLFVNLDADLYSSTVVVLDALAERLRPGTLLYFDEFNHRADELRAFSEFLDRTGMRFRLLAATRTLAGVLFERVS
jgi:hypothetical protein